MDGFLLFFVIPFILMASLGLFIHGIIYLVKLRELIILVEEKWPEKWEDLGRPKLYSITQKSLQESRSVMQFVRSPGPVDDIEITKMHATVKRLQRRQLAGIVIYCFLLVFSLVLTYLLVGGHTWIRDTSLVFSPTELPEAVVGQKYEITITISNNDTPVSSISGDKEDLPPGLTLIYNDLENTAIISGIPEIAGGHEFNIRAACLGTNKNGQYGEQSYRLVVRDQ